MGPKFAVHDNAVNVHASNLEQSEQSMNAQAAAFLQAVEPLAQEWKGSSYSSWDALMAAWTAAMKDLNAALASIKGNVKNAGGLYDSYESQMTEALSAANGSADWDGVKFRF
jgi:WXG100 family type VII secretion target